MTTRNPAVGRRSRVTVPDTHEDMLDELTAFLDKLMAFLVRHANDSDTNDGSAKPVRSAAARRRTKRRGS